MFNNELDFLKLRLTILNDVVDQLVLVEAGENPYWVGQSTALSSNIERFGQWRERIEHVVLPALPHGEDAWAYESAKRNSIALGLPTVVNDDLVIISDVDEIPRREGILKVLWERSVKIIRFRAPLFYLRFNYLQIGDGDPVYIFFGGGALTYLPVRLTAEVAPRARLFISDTEPRTWPRTRQCFSRWFGISPALATTLRSSRSW
jgi:hypothetical protein